MNPPDNQPPVPVVSAECPICQHAGSFVPPCETDLERRVVVIPLECQNCGFEWTVEIPIKGGASQ